LKVHSTYNVKVFQTIDTLNIAAANLIIEIANKAIKERGRFLISLSGGQTPVQLYSLLTQPFFSNQIPWEKTFVFWGDERCVASSDERNNAHQAKSILLDRIDIPTSNIYPIPVSLSPSQAAAEYEKELKIFFGKGPMKFDLVLLGLGENGHTASLFPGMKVIDEQAEGIREVYLKDEKMHRVTMTAPLINQAHNVLFLVTGGEKAMVLEKVLTTSYQPDEYPAQLIKPVNGELYWFIDQASASLINI
jgi:6-phosphogluconolactonase